MPNFEYPTSAQLTTLAEEKMINLTTNDPIFMLAPIENSADPFLIWEQSVFTGGLQAGRGIGGAPTRVKLDGFTRNVTEPGYYGEFITLSEQDLTVRRAMGDWSRKVSIADLVMKAQDKLLYRRLNRIKKTLYDLFTDGNFVVTRDNIVMHQGSIDLQTVTAGVAWSNLDTATPLANLRTAQMLVRGTGSSVDARSIAMMNRVTFNNMIANRNTNDLGGRQGYNLQNGYSINQLNQILTGMDLPQIRIQDDSYTDESGNEQFWLADGEVLIKCSRSDGENPGAYRFTLNSNTPNATGIGAYQYVIDRGESGPGQQIPRTIEIHDGHNGGPCVFRPTAAIKMNV